MYFEILIKFYKNVYPPKLKEQLAVVGRAKIEKSRLEKMAQIEENRKAALASLNIKYASADKAKTSFGFIGITFLGVLCFAIILNDLAKLFRLCYEETRELLKERREQHHNEKEKEFDQVTIQLEDDEKYLDDLEEKLDKVHWQLVKNCAARRIIAKK